MLIIGSCADDTFCIRDITGTRVTRTENLMLLCMCDNCDTNEPLAYSFQMTGYYPNPLVASNGTALPSIAYTFTSSDFVALQITGKFAAPIAAAGVSQVSTPAPSLCRRPSGRRHHRGWHRLELPRQRTSLLDVSSIERQCQTMVTVKHWA